MKLIYKSFIWLLVGGSFLIQPLFAQTSGGPDQFGYTWKNSDDPEGPAFEWVDISGTSATPGTLVEGLGDDNSVPMIPMGITFQYYWLEFEGLKMGSNGWLSFSNVGNVAHCFPSIPQSGGGNNLLAPLMSDLNFDEATNPAELRYLNDGNGRFIVSYINVPFWVNATPMFTGSNTFQVIIDSNDNSITFNYLDVESGVYNSNDPCTNDAVIGIENTTGTIGLQIAVENIPNDGTAIRFEYPEMSTFEITDIAASFNIDPDNLARFYMPDETIPLASGLTNTGNVDIENAVSVLARISAPNGTNYQQIAMTEGTIPAGESVSLELPPLNPVGTDNLPGNYSFSSLAGLGGDLVGSNNENISEFSVVDISQEDGIELSYVRGETTTTQASWSGGGGNSGMAVFVEPPFYPANIKAVEMFVFGDQGGNLDDAFTIEIRDDDGPNGSPGTLIGLESVDAGTYNAAGEWLLKDLAFPITVTSGGVYVTWVMQGNTLAIGTETTAPFSRRVFELVGGAFAQYRSNETADIMIRTILENPFFVAVDDVELDNGVKVFPNPTNGLVNIDNQLAEDAISRVQVYNTLGQVILDQAINIAAGDLQSIDLSNQPHGIYYLNIQADKAQVTRKISLTK